MCFVYGRSTSQRGEKPGQFLQRGLQASGRRDRESPQHLQETTDQPNIVMLHDKVFISSKQKYCLCLFLT